MIHGAAPVRFFFGNEENKGPIYALLSLEKSEGAVKT